MEDCRPNMPDGQPLLAGQRHSSSSRKGAYGEELPRDLFYCYQGKIEHAAEASAFAVEHGRPFAGSACCMAPDNPIRGFCIRLICGKLLDIIVLVVVMSNSIFMLLEPLEYEEGSAAEARSIAFEWASMYIFTVELAIRLTACGLVCHKGAFLHDIWNWIDTAVVVPFWLLLAFPSAPSLSSLRLVRVLRPLRTIRTFPELRRTVEGFLRAIPALSTVAALTCFFFLVFGVFGIEIFAGSFHTRCIDDAMVGATEVGRRGLKGGGASIMEGAHVTYCSLSDEPSTQSACGSSQSCQVVGSNPIPIHTYGNLDSFRTASLVLLQARASTMDHAHSHVHMTPSQQRACSCCRR